MVPVLKSLDHLVLTVADIGTTVAFYTDVLGMTAEVFQVADGVRRHALKFGEQKINLHLKGHEFEPKALAPTAGSADLCFLTDTDLQTWLRHLEQCGVAVLEGPVARTGADGTITSIYIVDPDGNLIEISVQD
jgi:catechol 2,3-dioxygenase-like lactoylglutathione lyase family enzyme